MMQHYNYSLTELENMMPWERDIYIGLLADWVEKENQRIFSEANYEYPLDYNNSKSKIHLKWGRFKADSIDLSILGKKNAEAVKIFDLAGWE